VVNQQVLLRLVWGRVACWEGSCLVPCRAGSRWAEEGSLKWAVSHMQKRAMSDLGRDSPGGSGGIPRPKGIGGMPDHD
jgi:hypothetical protein